MAVAIDTIYQRVLNILNKEQRGYITPQEFNLLANQAQLEIFDQYFYDLNQFNRLPGNSTEYSNVLDILNEKISLFEVIGTIITGTSTMTLPATVYKLGSIMYKGVIAERIKQKDILLLKQTPLAAPTADRPVYVKDSSKIEVYYNDAFTKSTTSADVTFNYIKKPTTAEWTYTDVGGNPLYNSANVVNFELHESEESKLVINILGLAGLVIKDPSVYQIASTEENKTIQQEKS